MGASASAGVRVTLMMSGSASVAEDALMAIASEDVDAGRVAPADVVDPDQPPLGPVHPGEILTDWIADTGLGANASARSLHAPCNRVTTILRGERAITGEMALGLARHFGTSAAHRVNLQAHLDLKVAGQRSRVMVEGRVATRAEPEGELLGLLS
jgi:addiction module HigA family antidote